MYEEMCIQSFMKLAEDPNLLVKILENGEWSFPNIPLEVYDGEVFWTTLAKCNGYKLQQNMFFKHVRILNDKKVRIAWGTLKGMEKELDKMIRLSKKYHSKKHHSRKYH